MLKKDFRFREISYNYTSFSDKEIILKYFDSKVWEIVNELREHRITGRSAKLLYEIIGDIFIIERNPYLFEEFYNNKKKRNSLKKLHRSRIETVRKNAKDFTLVLEIIERINELDEIFFKSFLSVRILRQRLSFALRGITLHKNLQFTPFHRVSHATDASDWRVEHPFAVVYPDSINEISKIVKVAKKLGLTIIPRGGGTGLTGGAVPVNKKTIIINTEKFTKIGEIETIEENGIRFPIITTDAGVVTEIAIEHCEKKGYVFATDPTSSWASTIGGNIAENAGGKKCVMWGTTIDNLYSFTLIDSNGEMLYIKRHNHPYHKILPTEEVVFNVYKKEQLVKSITLSPTDVRKRGLGKDITNKALKGVPGLQKEGGDGIIVSAQFVLYTPFKYCKTICLEFFGTNMIAASKAIVEINDAFINDKDVYLTALEHFDEKYVLAINYRNKSSRNEIPKAVLLIDIESNDEKKLVAGCDKIVSLVKDHNAEGIMAKNDMQRKIYWNDRKQFGAISKHTNAFKLNEDIVIPLENLPRFADFIEHLNFQKEIANSISTIENVSEYLTKLLENGNGDTPKSRVESVIVKFNSLKLFYSQTLENLINTDINLDTLDKSIFKQLQDGEVKILFDNDVTEYYKKVFHGYDNLLEGLNKVVSAERSRKIIIATHMHAGDGNIHVNIPVHSNDYLMMQEADECVTLSMVEAAKLGGVISGEHGIGLTKLKYIEKRILDEYQEYKKEADPGDIFNTGKLSSDFPLYQVYTPSFNLLEREAIILEYTDLEKLSKSVSPCVRCGKCKAVCSTQYPTGNMMYNPRNKILAVGAITEAVLFSAQTLDMKSFENFKNFREISDNCTVCHKCQTPCPVKIDFGDVSLAIRKQLVHRKKTSTKTFTNAALFYLGRKKYFINKVFRIALLKYGYSAQRIASIINKPISYYTGLIFPKINNILRSQFPKSGNLTIREIFKLTNSNMFYSFENPNIPATKSVVYFPGCGSERMFPEISLAVIALLYNKGIRVVIPPDYLCCGYPFLANGKIEVADLKSYENRVIFHRMADTAGYLNFDAVVVSCGTCYEMLNKYELENIFNNAPLIDINEYIAKENLYAKTNNNGQLFYHEPCHTPLKHKGYEKTFTSIYGGKPTVIPECCGEAGTLALSRPDISNTLRDKKVENIEKLNVTGNLEVLTTCPSCVMGLSKLNAKVKINAKSMAVYNAEQFLGKDWKKQFVKEVKKNGVEKILF